MKGLPAAFAALALAASLSAAASGVFQHQQPAAGALPSAAAQATPAATAPEAAVRVRLLADRTAALPGRPLQLAVELRHAPGWHTYWKNPGEAGAPTEFAWSLPAGWRVSGPRWPAPEPRTDQGITSYTVSGRALYPFQAFVPPDAGGQAKLSVHVSWIACREQCVPGEASASLTLPVAASDSASADARAIGQALEASPRPLKDGVSAAAGRGVLLLTAVNGLRPQQFIPEQPGLLDETKAQVRDAASGKARLALWLSPKLKSGPARISGVLFAEDSTGRSRPFALDITPAALPPGAQLPKPAPVVQAPPAGGSPGGEASRLTLASAALFAALGGLILNLMPCVFPVLSLKMLGLVRASGERRLLPHGLAFTAGVLLSMAALSALLLALKAMGSEIGWGFQLQTPLVVLLLALLFWAITLNLAGLYEFTFGSRAAGAVASKTPARGVAGSFFTGILAVVVASPCTAPFMGAAVGFALAQPGAVSIIVFLSLGLGMSLPWLLLTLFPGWTRRLPRPGAWMETLRHVMAVPVGLAALWLLWVLSRQVSLPGLACAVAALLLAGLALLLLGLSQRGRRSARYWSTFPLAAAAALVVAVGAGRFNAASPEAAQGWKAWSPEAVQEALSSGSPVFVDFTAAWCVTCQVNQAAVVNTSEARQLFARYGYARLAADWTSRDEKISRELNRYGRSGVPLYLVISRDGRVEVLPELLTPEALAAALKRGAS